ncbi:hypothetical protein EVAR_79235_1 [Eumeta japonica]|uniref:Uncharacterized protein n=1 Tax=Eumeta variegata TaxID=151549 RepID=A0A4C1ZAC2_EUMVA|nr:hypothetical protein EVAR_79235_1 [Eumeta japonica]
MSSRDPDAGRKFVSESSKRKRAIKTKQTYLRITYIFFMKDKGPSKDLLPGAPQRVRPPLSIINGPGLIGAKKFVKRYKQQASRQRDQRRPWTPTNQEKSRTEIGYPCQRNHCNCSGINGQLKMSSSLVTTQYFVKDRTVEKNFLSARGLCGRSPEFVLDYSKPVRCGQGGVIEDRWHIEDSMWVLVHWAEIKLFFYEETSSEEVIA